MKIYLIFNHDEFFVFILQFLIKKLIGFLEALASLSKGFLLGFRFNLLFLSFGSRNKCFRDFA